VKTKPNAKKIGVAIEIYKHEYFYKNIFFNHNYASNTNDYKVE